MSDLDDQLPADLRDIAARLVAARVTPSPLELDELRRRVRTRAGRDGVSSRRGLLATMRLTDLAARVLPLGLVLAVAIGVAVGGWSAAGGGAAKNTTVAFANAANFSNPPSATCSQYGGCCPAGTRVSLQFHYSSGGSGSWSGTASTPCPGSVSIGPADMEGDEHVNPGDTIHVGYELRHRPWYQSRP